MSLIFIHEFQKTLYDSLVTDQNLIKLTNKIYIGPSVNPQAPFITIRFSELEDKSQFQQIIFNIDFIISIYVQAKHYQQLTNIADLIITNVGQLKHISNECQLIGVKVNKIHFIDGKDLAIHKADIHFKSSITKR